MTMQLWDSVDDLGSLRRALRLLLVGDADFSKAPGSPAIPIDMRQTKNAIVLKASVPGVAPDEIDVSVSGNLLTIQAVSETDEDVSEGDYLVREHRCGLLSRSVTLPVDIDADKAEAAFDHGVLTITLPKAAHAKAKPVRVKRLARAKAARKHAQAKASKRGRRLQRRQHSGG